MNEDLIDVLRTTALNGVHDVYQYLVKNNLAPEETINKIIKRFFIMD